MDCSIVLTLVAVMGIDFGWQAQDDGSLEYIIQVDSLAVQAMLAGEPVVSEIHPDVHGVRTFRIQIGDGELPRDAGNFVPSQSAPSSQYQPIVVHDSVHRQHGPTLPGVTHQIWDDSASSAPALVDPQGDREDTSQRPNSRFSAPPKLNNPVVSSRLNSPLRQPNSPAVSRDELSHNRTPRNNAHQDLAPKPQADFIGYDDPPEVSLTGETQPQFAEDPRLRNNVSSDRRESESFPRSGSGRGNRDDMDRGERDDEYNYSDLQRSPSLKVPPNGPRRQDADQLASRAENNRGDRRDLDEDLRFEGGSERARDANRGPLPDRRHGEVDTELDSRLQSKSTDWPTTLLGLFASLAANAYMGWITWSAVHRYRDLVDDVRRVEN